MTDKSIITPSKITSSLNRYVPLDMEWIEFKNFLYNVVFTYAQVKKTFLCLIKT